MGSRQIKRLGKSNIGWCRYPRMWMDYELYYGYWKHLALGFFLWMEKPVPGYDLGSLAASYRGLQYRARVLEAKYRRLLAAYLRLQSTIKEPSDATKGNVP